MDQSDFPPSPSLGLVDFHTHIIPNVDDGSKGMAESLATIDMEIEQGVTDIVCTSHYGAGNQGEIDYDLIERQYAALCDEVQKSKRPISLHLGAELFGPSNEYILHHVKAQKAHTIAGGNYILVEFAEWSGANETAENISQRMIALAAEGSYHPILAHAERYRDFQGKEHLYDAMVNAGVKLQINLYDVIENKDAWVRSITQQLLLQQKVFVVGSDTHGYRRPPAIKVGADWIKADCDQRYADAVLFGNAKELLR